ncbi:MAG: alpha/beta fold hydrolase [Hyphomicrobiales bacterium]
MTIQSSLQRDGVQLSSYSSPNGGRPVVFQHGLGGDHLQIDAVFPLDADCSRMTLECRCHGNSEVGNLEQLSISTFSDDVIAMAKNAGLDRFIVGGISMGAAISIRIAVTHPELVSGLILGRPAWLCDSAPENMKLMSKIGILLSTMDGQEARNAFLKLPEVVGLSELSPDNFNGLLAFFEREPKQIIGELLERISNDGPGVSEDDLARIDVPTLIVGTHDDVIHPMSYANQLGQLIPNSQVVEITSKSKDLDAYTTEFQNVISKFLREFS